LFPFFLSIPRPPIVFSTQRLEIDPVQLDRIHVDDFHVGATARANDDRPIDGLFVQFDGLLAIDADHCYHIDHLAYIFTTRRPTSGSERPNPGRLLADSFGDAKRIRLRPGADSRQEISHSQGRLQAFGKDEQAITRAIKIMDDGFVTIATCFVQSTGCSIDWQIGRFYQQQTAAASACFSLHPPQKSVSDAPPPGFRIYGDPVKVEGTLGEGMGTKACVA
jgi:hypothetical protein